MTVHIWRVSDGETLYVYEEPSSNVQALAWSPDSTRIVSGYYNEKAYVWKAMTGETLLIYQDHTHEIVSLSWSADAQYIASASNFGRVVSVWDASSGRHIFTCEADYVEYEVTSWSPNGQLLACAGDTQLQVWDGATQKMTSCLQVTDTLQEIYLYGFYALSWSPDGRYIATGDTDAQVRIWDIVTAQEIQMYRGHTSIIHAVAWSPDGNSIASASDDGTVRIWDVSTGHCITTYSTGPNGRWIRSVVWSPDSQSIAYGEGSGEVQLRRVV